MKISIVRDENYTFKYTLNSLFKQITDEELQEAFGKLNQPADNEYMSLIEYKQIVAIYKYIKLEKEFNQGSFSFETIKKRLARNRHSIKISNICFKHLNNFPETLYQQGPDYIAQEIINYHKEKEQNLNT